jgi:F-type H+-transporting ATPase subunit b
MITLDWTILVAGAVFLLTLVLLNRVLFKPLSSVLKRRKALTSDVREEAAERESYSETLLQEYEERVKAQRQEGYQYAELKRKQAFEQRLETIAETRREAEELVTKARSEIEGELESVKQELAKDAEEIGRLIAARVLHEA